MPVLLALVALPLAAAPVPKTKEQPDAALIVGAWHDGRDGECAYWHFEADGVAGTGAKKNPKGALYRLDPSKKQFDWSQNGGKTWFLGVYELDGDTLKIALGQGGTGQRPESVDDQTRPYQQLTLKRVKE
jgi:uncharacterized protein (TIGR03067 family)